MVYHQNISGSSSWKVFGNLRKFSENVQERSPGLQNNFGKSSEIFRKQSEIFGKSSKTPSSVCLCNTKNIICQLKDMNFMFSWREHYLTRSSRYCSCYSNIKLISSRHCVISSTYFWYLSIIFYQLSSSCKLCIVNWHRNNYSKFPVDVI